MFIKFEDLDLFEFFESEPIVIGQYEAGNHIYKMNQDDGFSIMLSISTYERIAEICISYKENIVFNGKYFDVLEIVKNESSTLSVICENSIRIILKCKPQIGAIVET